MKPANIFGKQAIAALAVASVFAVPLNIAKADPAWLFELKTQLAQEIECEVSEYLRFYEDKIGERELQTARVKCQDGRQFDASRMEPQKKFRFQRCDVQAC